MKTKENQDRQSAAAPRQERRAHPEDSAPERKKRPASGATGSPAPERRRPAEAAGKSPRQQKPAQSAPEESRQRPARTAQSAPEEARRPARTAQNAPTQSRQRPAPAAQKEQPAAQRQQTGKRQPDSRPARSQSTAQQQPRRRPSSQSGGISVTPPQGTGPRKSAPRSSSTPPRRSATGTTRKQEKKNPVQNLLSAVVSRRRMDPEEKARLRRKQEEAREKRKAAMGNAPVVIYTQPQSFNRDRLILELISIMAVVAALILGMSVFFKVKTITVAGAETYSTWAVQEASGIKEGDNLLTFSKTRARAKILANMAYVDSVRIGIKLPDTVIIYVEELDVAYAIKSGDGDWWLMNSSGKVVEQITQRQADNYTQVLGVTLDSPQPTRQGVAMELPAETSESGELIPVTVTGAQRLATALDILKALEDNDIVGDAKSVDVTQLSEIMLWYGSRYEVHLGDNTKMDYKIACMNDAILQMSDYQTGILDISFTTWPDQVGYTPFG